MVQQLLAHTTLQSQQFLEAIQALTANSMATSPSRAYADDNAAGRESAPQSTKWTKSRAAPFHGWSAIKPGHLTLALPPFFPLLLEASKDDKQFIIRGLFWK